MSTTYTLDVTNAMAPVRRASSSLQPKTAESSHRDMRACTKILLISAAVAIVVSVFLANHIENPSTKYPGCIVSAYRYHSLVHPYVSSVSIERDWHTDGPPILSWPTTNWIATSSCDHSLNSRNIGSQIQY